MPHHLLSSCLCDGVGAVFYAKFLFPALERTHPPTDPDDAQQHLAALVGGLATIGDAVLHFVKL